MADVIEEAARSEEKIAEETISEEAVKEAIAAETAAIEREAVEAAAIETAGDTAADETAAETAEAAAADSRIPIIQVKNLYKIYRVGETKVYALNGVDFTMYKGEFCAIVGPSGSGKSTLLNMLAGLEKPSKGEIIIGKTHIEKLKENELVAFRRRQVGFIFQSYNLLQTLNAVENVALPLSFRGVPKKERNAIAKKYLKEVGLEKQMKHMANAMSGGQQQRVGIARALAANPQLLLLDEPFSNLDVFSKQDSVKMLLSLLNDEETVLISSHDIDDIDQVIDRAVVLRRGRIVQDVVMEELHERGISLKECLNDIEKYDPNRVNLLFEEGSESHVELPDA